MTLLGSSSCAALHHFPGKPAVVPELWYPQYSEHSEPARSLLLLLRTEAYHLPPRSLAVSLAIRGILTDLSGLEPLAGRSVTPATLP